MPDEIIKSIVDNSFTIARKNQEEQIRIQNKMRADRSDQILEIANRFLQLMNKMSEYANQNDDTIRNIDLQVIQNELDQINGLVQCLD